MTTQKSLPPSSLQRGPKKAVIIGSAVVLAIVAAVVILYLVSAGKKDDALASFEKKAELLREQVLSDARLDEISGDIEVGLPDNVVFLPFAAARSAQRSSPERVLTARPHG